MYTIKQTINIKEASKLFMQRKRTAIVLGLALIFAFSALATANFRNPEYVEAAPTDEGCFTFDSGVNTITNYTPNGTTCPLDVEIPSVIDGVEVKTIGDNAFENKGLTSAMMPNTITSIGNQAFKDNNISSVSFSTALAAIGTEAFINNDLTSVSIPNTVTGIGMLAFYNNQLTSVSVSNSLVVLSNRVFGNNQLTSVTIPDSVTTVQEGAFENNQLTSVTIPNSVMYIGEDAFAVNFLTSLTIPDSVIFIGEMAFHGNMLSSVELGNSVDTIGNLAFSYNRIDSITLPSSLTSLGQDVFHIQCLYHVSDFPGGDPEEMFPTFWLAQVFTEDPSNPLGLTDEIRYENYFSADFNNDGDMDDIVTGHLINPTYVMITYKDLEGNNLRSPQTLMGQGLESRLSKDNVANDPSLYYKVGGSGAFTAPNITGYVTPPVQTSTFVLGINTVNFVYQPIDGSDSSNEVIVSAPADDEHAPEDSLAKTGTDMTQSVAMAMLVIVITAIIYMTSRRVAHVVYQLR